MTGDKVTHVHGWGFPPPRSKGEYVRHLRLTHGDERVNEHMWSLTALKEEHAGLHEKGLT